MAVMLSHAFILMFITQKGTTMATPTFDTIEAQASYGIGLQVGQQLSESGLRGLLPEALVAGRQSAAGAGGSRSPRAA